MAVKYVDDFTFAPSPPRPTIRGYARGGHVTTPQRYASGGLAKGRGQSNDAGHTGGNGADRFSKRPQGDGPVKYMAKGGLAKGKGQSNDTGHSGGQGPDGKGAATRGQGDGDLKRSKVSPDIGASRTEKSSGVQKPAFAKGGYCAGGREYAKGGTVKSGKVKVVDSGAVNPNDAVSPGSFKKTPPAQSATNAKAAKSTFSNQGRNTPVATKQAGNVERMAGFSDFAKGGSASFNRIKNLGHYAHGGKVKASGEKGSGTAKAGAVKAPVKATNAGKAERAAGTPKTSAGSRVEMKGGTAKASMGGLSRGANPKKNAAIHAKSHKPKAHGPGLAALAGALSGAQMPLQGPQAGPGQAPGMGAPPGGPMGGMAPQGPGVGGGPPPAMSHGGVMHVVHHHQ